MAFLVLASIRRGVGGGCWLVTAQLHHSKVPRSSDARPRCRSSISQLGACRELWSRPSAALFQGQRPKAGRAVRAQSSRQFASPPPRSVPAPALALSAVAISPDVAAPLWLAVRVRLPAACSRFGRGSVAVLMVWGARQSCLARKTNACILYFQLPLSKKAPKARPSLRC